MAADRGRIEIDGTTSRVHREMACTRADFMGWLAAATDARQHVVTDDVVTVVVDGGRVEITLREASPRRLGAITLPVLNVHFDFREVDDAGRNAFLERFDLCSRRGGG